MNVIFCIVAALLSVWRRWFLYLLIIFLSAINTSFHTSIPLSPNDRSLVFEGTVIGEEPREEYTKLSLELDNVIVDDKRIGCGARAELFVPGGGTFLGKRIFVKGKIRNSKYQRHSYLLAGTIVGEKKGKIFWGDVLYSVRKYIIGTLENLLDQEFSDLGIGLLIGGSGRLKRELKEAFSRAGVLHLLAVSGLHVGFVCAFTAVFLFFIPFPQRIKFIIMALILLLYIAVTGFRPSVCRAGMMFLLFGVALLYQRNVDGMHIVNITALIFLLVNPFLLFDPGTQLSFAAVYGILFLYPKFDERFLNRINNRRIYKFIILPMVVSFSAQIFVAPFLIYYFHRLPVFAVLSNLIVLPLASVVIFLLFIALFTGLFYAAGARLIMFLTTIPLKALVGVTNFFTHLPFAVLTLYVPPVFLILFYLLFNIRVRKYAVFSIIGILCFVSLFSLSEPLSIRTISSDILVTTPAGENILIERKKIGSFSNIFLKAHNIRRIDYLIGYGDRGVAKKGFFLMPDELHYKFLKFDETTVEISEKIFIRYKDAEVVLNKKFESDDGTNGFYIMTDGKKIRRFKISGFPSIVEQMITDIEYFIARIQMVL